VARNRAIGSIQAVGFATYKEWLAYRSHMATRQLSFGERMKCEFIMAMLHGPELVFLDEPKIGLDVFAKENIRDFI